jgi:predicted kinase
MRGLPGSGKSYLAERIAYGFQSYRIHATDDLCMEHGEYEYDPTLSSERHAQNLSNFVTSLAKRIECVICDNTNISTREYSPYLAAANTYGYNYAVIELPLPSMRELKHRNRHKIPVDILKGMVARWEPTVCVYPFAVELPKRTNQPTTKET